MAAPDYNAMLELAYTELNRLSTAGYTEGQAGIRSANEQKAAVLRETIKLINAAKNGAAGVIPLKIEGLDI